MKQIRIYHTHIEVEPYTKGEVKNLEYMMSAIDKVSHKRTLQAYHIEKDTLFLPRGVNVKFLEGYFGDCNVKVIKEPDKYDYMKKYEMVFKPKDRIQEESVKFLMSRERFASTKSYSQKMLTIDTGDGKTFCTIDTIIEHGINAIIITHKSNIKEQWIASFKEMTTIDHDKLYNIDSSDDFEKILDGKVNANIYFVNHQSIQSFVKKYDWNKLRELFNIMKIGIKVVDEVHQFLGNTYLIDMYTNCYFNIYLTATPNRTSYIEDIIFKKSFSSAAQFGFETRSYEEKRKHIVYIPVLFRSKPSQYDLANMLNDHGFSAFGYADYAFYRDPEDNLMYAIEYVLNKIKKLEGKDLITTSKIDCIEFIKKKISKFDLDKSISTIHSKQKEIDNIEAKKSDIIISTVNGSGTGFDVRGLRCLINTEPFCSMVTFNQLTGRAREYSKTEDTYIFDLIDLGVPQCNNFYKMKLKYAKIKCKKIVIDDTLLNE